MSDWTDPAWRAEADAWIEEQLGRLGLEPVGELDQVHDRPWSTVIRVPTASGDVFFKAVAPPLRHEAALTELLGARRPDCVPPPLAVDRDRGWMLMEDGGQTLRELIAIERDLSRWRRRAPALRERPDRPDGRRRRSCSRSACPTSGSRRCRRRSRRCSTSSSSQPDDERRRLAGVAALGSRGVRGARRGGNPGDDPARRPPRRPGLRPRRPLPAPRLGRRLRLAPVLHASRSRSTVSSPGASTTCEGSEPTEPFRDAYLEPFRGRTTSDLVAPVDDGAAAGMALPRRQQPSLAAVGREHAAAAAHVPGRSRVAWPAKPAR